MSWLSKAGKWIEHGIAKIPHTTAAEKRASLEATNQQIGYYQQAKADLDKTRADTEETKNMERKKISEKEIRSRQRVYKRAGFMSEPSAAPKETLG